MPSTTEVLNLGWSDGSNALTNNATVVGQVRIDIVEAIAGMTTNLAFPQFNFVLAKLALCYIVAQGALTLKTNSSGSPQDTFTLTAGNPLIWYANAPWPNIFAGAVTNLYVTNGGASAVQLDARVLLLSP